MSSVHLLTFLIFCCIYNVYCKTKVICAVTDVECMTSSVRERIFPLIITGTAHINPSDPLKLDSLQVNVPTMKYKLTTPIFTGLKNCKLEKLAKNNMDSEFELKLFCPLITLESQYDVDGNLDKLPVKGKGTFKVNYRNFGITVNGTHKIEFDAEGKKHPLILTYTPALDFKGEDEYEFNNLSIGGQKVSSADENMKNFGVTTREDIMTQYVHELMKNLKALQKELPVEEMLYKYV